MFRKILITAGTVAGVVAAALTFQSSANAADVQFGIHIGNGYHAKHFKSHDRHYKGHHRKGHHGHKVKRKHHFKHGHDHGYRKHAPKYHHGVMTNRELRRHLRGNGLYNIRITDRHHGIARVIADNRRGYVARYKVDTRSGHIMRGRIIRYHDRHDYRHHGRRHHGRHSEVTFYLN